VKNFTRENLRKIEDNWENVKTYLAATVRLVRKFGYRWENVVAPLALLPISFWLMKGQKQSLDKSSKHEDVTVQSDIRKWLAVALLKKSFSGSSDTTLRNLREALLKVTSLSTFPAAQLNTALGIDSFSDAEIEDLLMEKYSGKYTYLVLSLLYPDRDWKDTAFHEDHIFPSSEFGPQQLRKRGYTKEKIEDYQSLYNTIVNLELLTDTENLQKNATPFAKWIAGRDSAFKRRHLIPDLKSYDFDSFGDFARARKKLAVEQLKGTFGA
jgi:hypothetical protein